MPKVAVLLAPLLLLGASPAAPTGWGCTAETLTSGERCVFEGAAADSPGIDPRANVQSMANLASTLCALHLAASERSSATDAVEAHCRTEVAAVAQEACSLRGPLLDAEGRFLPAAKGCYRALTEVRQKAEWQASTVAPCCACLAEQHCVAAAAKCAEGAMTSEQVEASNAKCPLSACENACVGLLPDEASAESSNVKTRVSHR